MFDQLLPDFQRREPIELFMVNTNKTDPLLAAFHDRLLQSLRINVELERVCVKGIDLNRPRHRSNIHDCLNPPNDDAVRQRPIDKIHTLHIKLEHGLAIDLCPNPRGEFEDAGEAGDSAARDHEARPAWFELGSHSSSEFRAELKPLANRNRDPADPIIIPSSYLP